MKRFLHGQMRTVRIVRLVVVLSLMSFAAGVAGSPSHALAVCPPGESCDHYFGFYTLNNNSLLREYAASDISHGNSAYVERYMSRDVYPYSDQTDLFAPQPEGVCNGQSIETSHDYGEPAHYSFHSYHYATDCGNYTAFEHWHPYTPSQNPYTFFWYPGLYKDCSTSEPTGMLGPIC